MNIKDALHQKLPLVSLILALVMLVLSMAGNMTREYSDRTAAKIEWRIEGRLDILDSYIDKIWADNGEACLPLDLPEDMVIYRYRNDSLMAWHNQFSVINDDITSKLVFQRLTDMRNRITSPLSEIGEELSYINLGPKWYVVKTVNGPNNEKAIAGIEIKNTLIEDLSKTENGVNPNLHLNGRYTVLPLNHSGGSPVIIKDIPLFKIIYDNSSAALVFDNSVFRWLALLLLVIAAMLYLEAHRKFKVYAAITCILTLLMATAFIWALQMNGTSAIFSPALYADGPILFSLGSLLLLNTYITLFVLGIYLIKGRLTKAWADNPKRHKVFITAFPFFMLLMMIMLIVYINTTLSSVICNSNIPLEIYRWNNKSFYSILVYCSYIGLAFSILLMLQTIRHMMKERWDIQYDALSKKAVIIFSLITASYFMITSSVIGFEKEEDRVDVWANRLSVDRDLALEIQLRSVEDAIATDQIISSLAVIDNTAGMIQNRITDTYLGRAGQNYDMSARIIRDNDMNGLARFNEIFLTSSPIADGSRFNFMLDMNGRIMYAGAFLYYSAEKGITRVLVEIEPNSNREDKGYYSILGRFSQPGEINIPYTYSYAKYIDDRLISYKGNYPYPTITEEFGAFFYEGKTSGIVRMKGHTHFMHRMNETETIIISRPQRTAMVFFTSFSYLFLCILGISLLLTMSRRRQKAGFKSNYFRTRINTILLTSSVLILITMTIMSIIFVYKRNEVNMHNLMSSRISTVQAFLESRTKNAADYTDLMTPEIAAAVENISNTTKSDITLYTPEGKVFRSTTPEVFEKMIIGSRIDQKAFHNIRHLNQRYFIHQEKIADYSYWALYAPLFNNKQEIVAIVSVPYTDRNYDFRREAFFHAAMLVNLFLILLILSLLFSTREVNSMFVPLVEMGRKMNSADIHNLELINYRREDEISSLVDAYNRMVQDLSYSTKQLALAERDKAWSQMARQVAHEIKNPLTPIKLEIQRLIRLKQKGNPSWEEKFDKVSQVVLEHIDILTETANEFSTFAKLYSEEPVLLDLDKTLKDQLLIFDNKENIKITYIGMENALVMAPKPQLIRVFVNLITNAIQAVEIQQKETLEQGEAAPEGRVLICLRNGVREGFYDVVVDDSGPGVSEENQSRLFTPNFTTKSSGTGLGLAICRNIIEKCEGEISYQKSFALGGASFKVSLPKHLE